MIIIFGPAGAGKTVQGKLLADANNWHWLSVGQLLRDSNDPKITEIINKGGLAPVDKVNELIINAFNKISNIDQIVFDGFPREIQEAKWLLEKSVFHGHTIDAILSLEVSNEEIIKRLLLRKRDDDTPQAIKERLSIYHDKMKSVLDYFASEGIRIIRIDGMGTIEQVHQRIMEKLSK